METAAAIFSLARSIPDSRLQLRDGGRLYCSGGLNPPSEGGGGGGNCVALCGGNREKASSSSRVCRSVGRSVVLSRSHSAESLLLHCIFPHIKMTLSTSHHQSPSLLAAPSSHVFHPSAEKRPNFLPNRSTHLDTWVYIMPLLTSI